MNEVECCLETICATLYVCLLHGAESLRS